MQQTFHDPARITADRPADRMIAADSLVVYPEVQRIAPTKESVNAIARDLNYNKLGTLTVSARADGTFSLIDGQRRVAALKSRGLGSYRCKCTVYSGLSIQQEAELFLALNSVRVVGAIDRFAVGVTAKIPECIGVTESVHRIGWRVGRSAGPGSCVCTEALVAIWRHDKNGALLNRVLGVLNDAFGRDKHTLSGHLVSGVGRFMQRSDVDAKALTDKLRAKFSTPGHVVTMARTRRETEGGSMAANVAAVVERTYESRKKRL